MTNRESNIINISTVRKEPENQTNDDGVDLFLFFDEPSCAPKEDFSIKDYLRVRHSIMFGPR